MSRAVRATVVHGVLSVLLAGTAVAQAGVQAGAQPAIRPLAIEDAVGAVDFQGQSELGALSPDGALIAYATCDPRRVLKDTTGLVAATANSAFRSLGCELRMTALADGSTRTIATSDHGGHWGPAWSPDGRRLAFYSDRDGIARVWVWERSTGRLRRVSEAEIRALYAFERPLWIDDGKALVVKLFTTGVARSTLATGTPRMPPPADTVPGSTLILYRSLPATTKSDTAAPGRPAAAPAAPMYDDFGIVELATGRVRRVRQRVTPVWYQLAPDGRSLAYLERSEQRRVREASSRYELRVLELASGRERTLATDIGQEWPGSVTWAPNGRYLAYTTRPAPSDSARSRGTLISSPTGAGADGDAELYVVAAEGGEPRRFTGAPGPVLSSQYRRPLWTAGSDGILVMGARKLWRAEVASGTLNEVPTPFRVDQVVPAADRRTYWSPDGGSSLYVLTSDSASLRVGVAAVNLRTGTTRMVLQEQRQFASVFDPPLVTARGDAVVYQSESASESPDLWVAGVEFQAPRRLTTLNPQLARYTFGKSQLIEYRSHDGTPLRGTLVLPVGYEPGRRYPLVVWVYASDQGSRKLNRFGVVGYSAYNLHMLTTRGYAVLWPDIPVHVGTPMRDLMKSVMPAVDKVIELGIADPERLAVAGQSNGGYSTLALLVQTTRFKAAVMNAGFGDLTGFYGAMSPRDGSGGWHPWLEQNGGAMGAPPWEQPLRYVENSPVFYLDRVQTPLLIQAGSADDAIVPYSDQVFVGLKRLQKDVTYLRYGGEGHVLEQYPNLVDYWTRVLAFLDEKLKGAPAAPAQLGRQ